MTHPTANKPLTQKLIWHLKLLVGAFFISAMFSLALFQRIFHDGLLNMLILTFAQLEIFLWLGHLFFSPIKPDSPGFLKRTVIRLLLFYATVLLIASALFLALYLFYYLRAGDPLSEFLPNLLNFELKSFITATAIGFALGALFFFYTQWADALKRMQKLKEEKLIFQYETLKSQVNPHFLFNSLNTLSSLVRKDVELSERFIQKLSMVYRYVLENQDKDLVSVADELDFVHDFFYLQQIRDEGKIELKIDENGSKEARIIPVSLQMLVENALKHNKASRKEPLVITIHFEGLDKLVVRNNLQEKEQLGNSAGIGLKNLAERCKLILGRETEVQRTEDEFIVKLPVKSSI